MQQPLRTTVLQSYAAYGPIRLRGLENSLRWTNLAPVNLASITRRDV